MKSYSELEVFPECAVHLLKEACGIVELIPQSTTRGLTRCHEVARIVRDLIGPEYASSIADGKYGIAPRVEHSWILVRLGLHENLSILDPYCVGRLPMVQLLDPYAAGHASLYHASSLRTDIDTDFVSKQVARIEGLHRYR